MTAKEKLLSVISHVFSRKTVGYIALSFLWTMVAVVFWSWVHTGRLVLFESMEITLTVMGGKLLLYGIWDWLHLKEPQAPADARVVRIVSCEDPDDRFGEYCVL